MNARFESTYLQETAALNAAQNPLASAVFALAIVTTGFIEFIYRPEMLPVWFRFFVAETLVVFLPVVFRQALHKVQLFDQAVLLSWTTVILLVHAYGYVTGLPATVIGGATICFTTSSALLSAWSIRGQTVLAITAILAFALLALVRGDGGAETVYTMLAVVAAAAISIQGTRYLDLHRRAIFQEMVRSDDETAISASLEELARELNHNLGHHDGPNRVAALVRNLIRAPWVVVLETSPQTNEVHISGGAGSLPSLIDNLRALDASPLAAAITGSDELGPYSVDDWGRVSEAIFNRRWGETATLIPLRHKAETIGALIVGVSARDEGQRRLMRDVAQHVALGLANSALVKELRTANELKSEFLATMSHELRTPLHVIIGYTEILADKLDCTDSELSQIVDRLIQNEGALTELIEGTLNAHRIEAGAARRRCLKFDVQSFFEQIQADVRWLPRTPGIDLHWALPDDKTAMYSDPDKIKIIAKNVIGNALKFTKKGAVDVTVSVDRKAGTLELRVRDSGPGIPNDALPHIFDMFSQAGAEAAKNALAGVGLGLYIVREYAQRLGGRVSARNIDSGGAEICVTLPLEDSAASKSRQLVA